MRIPDAVLDGYLLSERDTTALHMFADALAMCRIIDAGDDSPITDGILADALEDAGDPRAAGVRLIGDRRPLFLDWALNDRWAWLEAGTPDSNGASRHRIASKTFALLPADGRGQKGRWRGIRSECFLALAQALTM